MPNSVCQQSGHQINFFRICSLDESYALFLPLDSQTRERSGLKLHKIDHKERLKCIIINNSPFNSPSFPERKGYNNGS